MAVREYTKPVQESQVKNYPKIDLGKFCNQSIDFGYKWNNKPRFVFGLLFTKLNEQICVIVNNLKRSVTNVTDPMRWCHPLRHKVVSRIFIRKGQTKRIE